MDFTYSCVWMAVNFVRFFSSLVISFFLYFFATHFPFFVFVFLFRILCFQYSVFASVNHCVTRLFIWIKSPYIVLEQLFSLLHQTFVER